MNIAELMDQINKTIPCVDWIPQKNPRDNAYAPTGVEYVAHVFNAHSDLFDNPENSLCRMALSQIKSDISFAKKIIKDKNLVLYWRIKPEFEKFCDSSKIKLRYAVSYALEDNTNSNK